MKKTVVVIDVETTGLNPRKHELHGIGLSIDGGKPMYVPEWWTFDGWKELLEDPDTILVGHNIRFDLKFLIENGIEPKGRFYCTKLLASLLNENQPLGLKDLTAKYLGPNRLSNLSELNARIGALKLSGLADLCRVDLDDPNHPHNEIIARYCREDVQNTLDLWRFLKGKLELQHNEMLKLGYTKTVKDYFLEEAAPLEAVILKMELNGIGVDEKKMVNFRRELIASTNRQISELNHLCVDEITSIEEELYEQAKTKRKSEKGKARVERKSEKYGTNFNWQSADHVAALFFDRMQAPSHLIETTKSGKRSTSEASLEALVRGLGTDSKLAEALKIYAGWKKNLKLLTTYTGEDKGLASHLEQGRIYAEYLQTGRGKEGTRGGTVTGRLSSRNPNMQNLPRDSEVKRFFVPDPDHVFVYFDYSQLELRLAAHLSQDPLLLKAYREGLDLHQLTADRIGTDRQTGKTVNFATIYDASSWRLSQIFDKTPEECQAFIDGFFDLYKGYQAYLKKELNLMRRSGRAVSEAGRIRRLRPDINEPWGSKLFKHAVKQGYNFPIQSLGASITKRAMIALHNKGYQIVTQVHDSVVIQVRPEQVNTEIAVIQHIAEDIYPLSVPLKAECKILTSLHEKDVFKGDRHGASATN